jgi:hypothetical protein
MLQNILHLDALLRGERTAPQALSSGRFDLPLRVTFPLAITLGAIYGFFMGWYAISMGASGAGIGLWQLIASMVKVPALFLLTLVVTFPSLYVFNALIGARLDFLSALRMLMAAIVVNLAVAASFGPIVGFFTLSTESYPFMIVLNVVLLGVAGVVGLGFLLTALRRLVAAGAWRSAHANGAPVAPPPADGYADDVQGASTSSESGSASAAGAIFAVWVLIYGLVGAQMGWLLRPFIGHPGLEFAIFRAREGNFFQGLFNALRNLLGG